MNLDPNIPPRGWFFESVYYADAYEVCQIAQQIERIRRPSLAIIRPRCERSFYPLFLSDVSMSDDMAIPLLTL